MSKAFTELPQSTEQILHPEKYFAHEPPVRVTLPDIAPVLDRSSGAEIRGRRSEVRNQRSEVREQRKEFRSSPHPTRYPQHPSSWRRLDSDVNGEWGFYLILDQFLKSPAESRRAAAGWGGDRFALYEGPRGEAMLVSLSVWDTENDAREFFDAYVKRTELRYADATAIEPTFNAQATAFSKSFLTSEGVVSMEVRGGRVLVLEGVPARTDVKSLKGTLWR